MTAPDASAAVYRDARAVYRPAKCNGGPQCWVENGAACWLTHNNNGKCLGCGDVALRNTPEPEQQTARVHVRLAAK